MCNPSISGAASSTSTALTPQVEHVTPPGAEPVAGLTATIGTGELIPHTPVVEVHPPPLQQYPAAIAAAETSKHRLSSADFSRDGIEQPGIKKLQTWSADVVPDTFPDTVKKSAKEVIGSFLKAIFIDHDIAKVFEALKYQDRYRPEDLQQISQSVKAKLVGDTPARVAFSLLSEDDCKDSIRATINSLHRTLSPEIKETLINEIYDSAIEKITDIKNYYLSHTGAKIARGGGSTVFKLENTDRPLVLKMPNDVVVGGTPNAPGSELNPSYKAAAVREAAIRGHLALAGGHEHVAEIIDITPDLTMVVEPMVIGKNGEKIHEKLLELSHNPEDMAAHGVSQEAVDDMKLLLLHDTVQGLAFMHREGVAHLDVKPANLLISQNGIGKITDFGECKFYDTETGNIGTPDYQAPETFRRGHICSGKEDVYSLGVIMGQILTGEMPFGENIKPWHISKKAEEGTPLSPFSQATKEALKIRTQGLYTRMCNPDPAQRPTMEEVRAAFSREPLMLDAQRMSAARLNISRLATQ